MVSANALYIAMHFDRLEEELLSETFGKQDKDKSQKKEQQQNPNLEMNRINDDHGL